MSVSAGQRLGPYEIVSRLGAGGMGEVYRARSPPERTVAIKVPPPLLAQSEAYRQRFQARGPGGIRVSHPNIAHVYDVGEQDGIHFIAMEYVEGENLRAVLARGPLDADKVAEVGILRRAQAQMAQDAPDGQLVGDLGRDPERTSAAFADERVRLVGPGGR